jgi:hypothetical protein
MLGWPQAGHRISILNKSELLLFFSLSLFQDASRLKNTGQECFEMTPGKALQLCCREKEIEGRTLSFKAAGISPQWSSSMAEHHTLQETSNVWLGRGPI